MRLKRLTIYGQTYRLRDSTYDEFVRVDGPGVVGGIVLPSGVSLDSSDLRDHLKRSLAEYRESRRRASDVVQRRVADGTAGIAGRVTP